MGVNERRVSLSMATGSSFLYLGKDICQFESSVGIKVLIVVNYGKVN